MNPRGQANLPPLAVALLVLTGAVVLGLTLASGALATADRAAEERRTAVILGERVVAADSPLAERANVLDRTRLSRFDAAHLESAFSVTRGAAVELTVDDEVVASTDDVSGPTVRRLVHVVETDERTIDPSLGSADAVTLPRRADGATVTLTPASDTEIETVRANDRVVLHDTDGLRGTFEVSLSREETTRLSFEANESLTDGSVEITVPTERTTKATLSVTVDA